MGGVIGAEGIEHEPELQQKSLTRYGTTTVFGQLVPFALREFDRSDRRDDVLLLAEVLTQFRDQCFQ